MDYVNWLVFMYPMFLIQLPLVTFVLFWTFKPEYRDLSRAVVKLRRQVEAEGSMKTPDWMAVVLFIGVLIGWIFYSDRIGMGTVAIMGATAFLIIGLVRWEDINIGVNWGVDLLYAAAISMGLQLK